MAKINNQAVIQKLIDELGLYPAIDSMPTELADKILPVFQVNTQEVIYKPEPATVVRSEFRGSSGSTTLYTTPATGDFYLTNLMLQGVTIPGSGDASCTVQINITVGGSSYSVAISKFTHSGATYGEFAPITTMNFLNPILIDKATDITLQVASFTEGHASIIGYTKD